MGLLPELQCGNDVGGVVILGQMEFMGFLVSPFKVVGLFRGLSAQ